MIANFKLIENHDRFHFRFMTPENKIGGTSENYTSNAMALKGIDSVKTHSPDIDNYEKRTAKNLQPYFVLKANNNEIIYTSKQFWHHDECDSAIAFMMVHGPEALTEM